MKRRMRVLWFWICYWLWRCPVLTRRMIGPVNDAYQAMRELRS